MPRVVQGDLFVALRFPLVLTTVGEINWYTMPAAAVRMDTPPGHAACTDAPVGQAARSAARVKSNQTSPCTPTTPTTRRAARSGKERGKHTFADFFIDGRADGAETSGGVPMRAQAQAVTQAQARTRARQSNRGRPRRRFVRRRPALPPHRRQTRKDHIVATRAA